MEYVLTPHTHLQSLDPLWITALTLMNSAAPVLMFCSWTGSMEISADRLSELIFLDSQFGKAERIVTGIWKFAI